MEPTIQKYINSVSTLIVDKNSSARTSLKILLKTIGVQLPNIHTASSLTEAQSIIGEFKPQIIFCDYQVGHEYGLNLLQYLKAKNNQEIVKNLFILVTSNTSQSAVAQAAEEDVDAYIIKPYTIESFTSIIQTAIQNKINPSMYLQLIEIGKLHLDKSEFEEAIKNFNDALSENSNPSLAHFYIGLANFKKNQLQNSKSSYEMGLTFNKMHLKCLIGLLDLFIVTGKDFESYSLIQEIIQFFPSNPERLALALRLAVKTQNYDDVEIFYDLFLKLENRNQTIIKYICSSLIISAKYYFSKSKFTKGHNYIQKAIASSTGDNLIMKNIVAALVEFGFRIEATSAISKFSNMSEKDSNYLTANFLVDSLIKEPGVLAKKGQDLILQGCTTVECFQITFRSLSKLNKLEESNHVLNQALKIYPDFKT